LVLTTHKFDEQDYIRDYNEYLLYKKIKNDTSIG